MGPFILPSSVFLDHSFPRSASELACVINATLLLDEMARQGKLTIVMTSTLCEFLSSFHWDDENGRGLSDLYRLVSTWASAPSKVAAHLAFQKLCSEGQHPSPQFCAHYSLSEFWEAEADLLRQVRDANNVSESHVGVADYLSFSGFGDDEYDSRQKCNYPFTPLSLLRTRDIQECDELETWNVDKSYRDTQVTAKVARGNLVALSPVETKKQNASHIRVIFANGYRWTLDMNWDVIGDNVLMQLCHELEMPLHVVKFALSTGRIPERQVAHASWDYCTVAYTQ